MGTPENTVRASNCIIFDVGTPSVGHDPSNASFGSGSDELILVLRGSRNGKGNDEELLTLESLDEAFLIIVVDLNSLYTVRENVLAVLSGESSDVVLSGLEKCSDDW